MKLNFEQQASLADRSTYRVGGFADYLIHAQNAEHITEAIRFAEENSLPYLILGGGSNILFSDKGFPGVVIRLNDTTIRFHDAGLAAAAGADMHDVVFQSINKGLKGLEWAGGLPGQLGGAIRGNAGCFGGEMKDIVQDVTVIEPDTGEIRVYSNDECEFGYRTSRFKTQGGIIVSATLQLEPGADTDELRQIAQSRIDYRNERHPMEFPSCGSVFKNCRLETVPQEVQERFKEKIKDDPFPILPTAVLLAALELQGLSVGGAKVSEKHPNFIVNHDGATAADVVSVIEEVKKRVKDEFGVELEEELHRVGFGNA